MRVSEPKPDKPYEQAERLVTALVQHENERLTRLLRNLYQEFRLGRGERSQLYEHICRELAQYFHCDCCQLYLVRHNLARARNGRGRLEESLVLEAAFGPWEQALKPRHVRRIFPTQYLLDRQSTSHSVTRYYCDDPTADICRSEYRGSGLGRSDVEWHLVWRRDNLYSTSRNILSCPVARHRSRGDFPPYKVGLIKLENRRPLLSRAFESDWATSKLYLGRYFELCSVAGYVKDLENRLDHADTLESLFAPLHDADGWRHHYQVHEAGKCYFQEVRRWQQRVRRSVKGDTPERVQEVREHLRTQYTEAKQQLSAIMDLVVEAETLLQELTTACVAMSPDAQTEEFKADLRRLPRGAPAPSFFNAVGLVKAGENTKWLKDAVCAGIERVHPTSDAASDPIGSCRDLAEYVGKTKTRAGSSRTSLWGHLVRRFLEENQEWGGLLTGRKRALAAMALCDLLRQSAIAIQGERGETVNSALSPARVAAHQCADAVLRVLGRNGGSPDQKDEVGCVKLLAKASADACMHAHTFDPRLDRTRVFSIQSHVSQILDNYLMDKARLAGLVISFDHIEILGLTESTVDELARLQKLLSDTAKCLELDLRRELTVRVGNLAEKGGAIPSRGTGLEPTDRKGLPSASRPPTTRARAFELREILDALVSAADDETFGPVDLVEVAIDAPEADMRELRCAQMLERIQGELPDSAKLLELKVRTHEVKLQMDISEGPPARTSERWGLRREAPVPWWLFELNEALSRFSERLSTLVGSEER